jgi:hypothetical protein
MEKERKNGKTLNVQRKRMNQKGMKNQSGPNHHFIENLLVLAMI